MKEFLGTSAFDEALAAHAHRKLLVKNLDEADRQLQSQANTVNGNLASRIIANNKIFTEQATEVVRKICASPNVREYIMKVVEKYGENKVERYAFVGNGPESTVTMSLVQQPVVGKNKQEEFRMDNIIGRPSTPDITLHLAIMFPFKNKKVVWEDIAVDFYERHHVSNRNETTWNKNDRCSICDPELNYGLLRLQNTQTALQVIVRAFDPDTRH